MRFSLAFAVALAAAGSMTGLARAGSSSVPLPSAEAFADVQSLDNKVLRLALGAVACARSSGKVQNDRLLTVIDYSKASTQPRLWVLDLEHEQVLFEELVAHGKGSGENFATRFSNADGSHQTSLGLFRTADTYVGGNGYSLRLDGLEAGFNDRARERAIVMHGAPYVSDDNVRAVGRLGRSHGCPALRPSIARSVIDTIKQGSLVFAYYPDKHWLQGSRFLNGCS
jgi:L,D-transpeptidase catalytic domain